VSPRSDVVTRTDVHDLVVRFYREVVFDDLLAPVFGEVAEVDWARHIPKLIDYWCRVVLADPVYDGAILGPHERLNGLTPLRPELFDRWYSLWAAAIDSGWEGPNARRAKDHAARISAMLSRRLTATEWKVPGGAAAPDAHASQNVARGADVGGESACWAHLVDGPEGSFWDVTDV